MTEKKPWISPVTLTIILIGIAITALVVGTYWIFLGSGR